MNMLAAIVFASVPAELKYQGKLTDIAGVGINGSYDVSFSIYDVETAGTSLWTETHPALVIDHGLFSVALGSVTSLDLPFDDEYWLEITVDGDIMSPRQKLGAEAYAFRALSADNVIETRDTMIAHWDSIRGIPSDIADGDDTDDADWIISGSNMRAGVTGNIGIGTSSPSERLHIVSNIDTAGRGGYIMLHNSSATALAETGIKFKVSEFADQVKGGILYQRSGAGWGRGNLLFALESGADNSDVTAADAKMTLTYDGNLGLGTSEPLADLHIVNVGTAGYVLFDAGVTAGYYHGLKFMQADTDELGLMFQKSPGDISKLHVFDFVGGSGKIMTFESTGSMGIGISNPDDDNSLHIVSKGETDSKAAYAAYSSTGPYGYLGSSQYGVYGQFDASNYGVLGADGIGVLASGVTYAASFDGDLFVQAGAKLNIGGDTGSNDILMANSSGGLYWGSAAYDDDWTVSGTDMYSIPSGNVGIGTSSPTGNLDIVSSGTPNVYIRTSASTSQDAVLHIRGARTTSTTDDIAQIQFEDNPSGLGLAAITARKQTGDTNEGKLFFWTTSTGGASPSYKMILDRDGNLGIGTSAPSDRLHIVANVDTAGRGGYLQLHNSSGVALSETGIKFKVSEFSDQQKGSIIYQRSSDGYGRGNLLFALDAGSNSNNANAADAKMTLTYQGNLGIGTSTPEAKIHTYNSGSSSYILMDGASTAGWFHGLKFRQNEVDQLGLMFQQYTGEVSKLHLYDFEGGGGKRITFQSTGELGIGTTSPAYDLDVNGDVNIDETLLINETMDIDNVNLTISGCPWHLLDLEYAGSDEINGAVGIKMSQDYGTDTEWMMIAEDEDQVQGWVNAFAIYSHESSGDPYILRLLIDNEGDWAASDVAPTLISDKRFKRDIVTIPNALERISKIRGVNYYWNDLGKARVGNQEDMQYGFIAQEMEPYFPTMTHINPKDGYYSLEMNEMLPVAVQAIKELKEENDELRSRIEELERLIKKEN